MNNQFMLFKKEFINQIELNNAMEIDRVLTYEYSLPENKKTYKRINDIILEYNTTHNQDLIKESYDLKNKLIKKTKLKYKYIDTTTIDEFDLKILYGEKQQICKNKTLRAIYKTISLPNKKELAADMSYLSLIGAYKLADKITPQNNPFDNKPVIYISGINRAGKTYLLHYIVKKLIENTISYQYMTAFELTGVLKRIYLNNEDYLLETLKETEYLLIDDLGSEPIYKNISIEYLQSIIDYRTSRNKPTFITTNLKPKDLILKYNQRISARTLDKFKAFALTL